jgi:hypothetical protein
MADDFVRQYPAGVVPMHRPKSLEENLRDEAIEWEARKRADPKLVSAAYDDINDAMSVQHQAAPTDTPDASERERIVREERQFLAAFERGLNDHLRQIQMRVTRCIADGEGTGWTVHVKDSENRPFTVRISYDDAIRAGEKHGPMMGVKLMGIVMRRLMGARDHYFARMQ